MVSFTGTRGEDTFCHVPVPVEAEGGPLVSMLFNAIAAAEDANPLFVIRALKLRPSSLINAYMCQHLKILDSTHAGWRTPMLDHRRPGHMCRLGRTDGVEDVSIEVLRTGRTLKVLHGRRGLRPALTFIARSRCCSHVNSIFSHQVSPSSLG